MIKATDYKICNCCIMDNATDENIRFDENGRCERCNQYFEGILPDWNYGKGHEKELAELLNKIKKSGKGKKYDCLLGFSGGFDSSYLLHMAIKEWGLRPLVFHIDAGFDLPVGKHNVEAMVKILGTDLMVETVNWNDVKNFQIALFKTGLASCLDFAQDHAFVAILDEYAQKHNIKYILNGDNISTEVIRNPRAWGKNGGAGTDLIFINDVLKRHASEKLHNYPFTNVIKRKIILPYINGVKVVKLLNLVPYIKSDAQALLMKEYGWEPYSQKHFESQMTKFLEGYWLPKRFGFDVRRAQLSSLILTNQISREKALEIVSEPTLTEAESMELFKQIARKLEISEEELQGYFEMPLWQNKYKNNRWLYKAGAKAMFNLKLDKNVRQ